MKWLACAVLLLAAALPARATYTIVQSSNYSGGTSSALGSDVTAGNTLVSLTLFCANTSCTSATCPTTSSMTDNGGSHGGVNQTYTVDQNTANTSFLICVDIGRFFDTAATTSAPLTISNSLTGSPGFQVSGSFEVNGLGTSPTFEASGTASSSGLTSVSTSASCSSGDLAVAGFYSTATMTAGSSWNVIGTVGSAHFLMEWQSVASSGTVTATISGSSGATGGSVVCYKPTSSVTAHTQVGGFLVGP